jgi:serine/threonine-protein kinase
MKTFLKIIAYTISFAAAGAIAGMLIYKIVWMDKMVPVPDITGRDLTEASEILNRDGLVINVEGKRNDDIVEEGAVIEQSIKAGRSVKSGTEIGVIISMGPQLYTLPSFEGQSLKDARLTLRNLGITVRKVTWVHSDDVAKGKIIAQRPLPGNIKSNEINFLVSLGPYNVTYKCPSFINMTTDEARTLAAELGIRLVEKDSGSRIIFQKPEAGAIIKRGDSVEIRLGRGWGMWF